MKAVLLSVLSVFVLTTTAQANDGGAAYLEVQGINPEGVKTENIGWDKPFLSFYGKEAKELAKTLPAPATVATAMMSPKDAELFKANERSLTLFSKGWLMSINCSGGEIVSNPEGSQYEYSYQVNKDIRGFKCSYTVVPREPELTPSDYLGDAFKFEPIDQELERCEKQ